MPTPARLLATGLALATLAALAPPAEAARPELREFRFQKVDTRDLTGADRVALKDEEVWAAPCFFEPKAFHDTAAFAVLVHVKDAVRTPYIGGIHSKVAPLDLSQLRSGGRPILQAEGQQLGCVRVDGSVRYGAVVIPYVVEGSTKTMYALVRVALKGPAAPDAILVGGYPTMAKAVAAASAAIPENDARLPAGWLSFLRPDSGEVCLHDDCPR